SRDCLDSANMTDSLLSIQTAWARIVNRKPLPWYAEEKLRSGAFSTLLGLTLRDGTDEEAAGTWKSIAVGDSCLVQLRGDEVLTSFPLSNSAQFSNIPPLICSNPAANRHLQANVQTLEGGWEPGDIFYLMTDALAAWFCRELEDQRSP